MNITNETWDRYSSALEKLDEITKGKVSDYIETHDIDSYEGRNQLIEFCYALVSTMGEAAAELACQMYDAVSELEDAFKDFAEPADVASYDDVAKAVNGTIGNLLRAEITAAAMGRLVKMAAQDTTLKNAIRDQAFFAWIPIGDTCPLCLSIAAEGWNKATSKALSGGHAKHIHGNCNCNYAIKHQKTTEYQSYNPAQYQEVMEQAEGSTEEDRMNSIRRMFYDQNSAKIRAQKRAAYEKRKELDSSEAEEISVK